MVTWIRRVTRIVTVGVVNRVQLAVAQPVRLLLARGLRLGVVNRVPLGVARRLRFVVGAWLVLLVVAPGPAAARARVTLGIDVLLGSRIDLVKGKRVGLLTNPSGVDGRLKPTVDRLIEDKRVNLVQLFAPEHGLAGDGKSGTSDRGAYYRHRGRKIPIQGLFGRRRRPTAEALSRIDVLLFDIQDIGSRTYTYVTTMGLAMQAAKEAKVAFIVLDRPNPLGGLLFEGAVRIEKYKSMIGWGPLPVTHGMTVGELARFYNKELGIGCKLTVVEMRGWRRKMVWADTGLHWVPTSPGIPHELNAHLYVATGMVGGSGPNVNEGGGASMPFELIGALFIDNPRRLARALNRARLPGVFFRPLYYRPRGRQFTRKRVPGVQLMLLQPRRFRPLRTALTVLVTLQRLYKAKLVITNTKKFGRVWGNDAILPMIRAGKSVAQIERSWKAELAAFAKKRAKYLIYP